MARRCAVTKHGLIALSRVNDSGFWLISRYLRITEKQTLKSRSVATIIISVLGWLGAPALALSLVA